MTASSEDPKLFAVAWADKYRAWARGDVQLEAAVELLARSHGGQLLRGRRPWLKTSRSGPWVDFELMRDPAKIFQPSERNVLLLAASLAECGEVNLGHVLKDLDRDLVDLVLSAVSHAAGSHQLMDPLTGMQLALHPWPEANLRLVD